MKVSVTEARDRLTELVRRAEAGDEVILTRDDQPVAKLVAVQPVRDRKSRRALMEAVREAGVTKAIAWPSAARSQDFLYGEEGLRA